MKSTNLYNKLRVIAEVEDYFGYHEDDLRNSLDALLTVKKDGTEYEIISSFKELALCNIRGERIEIKEFPEAVYRLARLWTLLEYSESEGETSYFILDIFFNKENEGVSFITLCQDVSTAVDWISETYNHEVEDSIVQELVGIFKRLHLEFSRLI
jgi:hypothetical protein|nr:MAG TPA: hypothetical protein [Bacteriophage sp.]